MFIRRLPLLSKHSSKLVGRECVTRHGMFCGTSSTVMQMTCFNSEIVVGRVLYILLFTNPQKVDCGAIRSGEQTGIARNLTLQATVSLSK